MRPVPPFPPLGDPGPLERLNRGGPPRRPSADTGVMATFRKGDVPLPWYVSAGIGAAVGLIVSIPLQIILRVS